MKSMSSTPVRHRVSLLLLMVAILVVALPAGGDVVSCIDTVHNDEETITITNPTQTHLKMQNCTFHNTLTITASSTLSNFTLVVKNSSFARTATIAVSLSSSSMVVFSGNNFLETLIFESTWTDTTLEFEGNSVANAILLSSNPSTGLNMHFNNNVIKSQNKRAAVLWTQALSSNSLYLWGNNLIDATAGMKGWYHESTALVRPTAHLKLTGNIFKANPTTYCFYVYHGGGQLTIESTNVFTAYFTLAYSADAIVGDYIHLQNADLQALWIRGEDSSSRLLSNATIIVEGSTVVGTVVEMNCVDSHLEFRNNKFTDLTAISFETKRTHLKFHNNNFQKQATFSRLQLDSVLLFDSNEFHASLMFANAPSENTTFHFIENSFKSTRDNLVTFEGSSVSSNSKHIWENNVMDTADGAALNYISTAVLGPTSLMKLTGNVFKTEKGVNSFSVHHGGGQLVVDGTNVFTGQFVVVYVASSGAGDMIHLSNCPDLNSVNIGGNALEFHKGVSISMENIRVLSDIIVKMPVKKALRISIALRNVASKALHLKFQADQNVVQESQLNILDGNTFHETVDVLCSRSKLTWDPRSRLPPLTASFDSCHVDKWFAIHHTFPRDESLSSQYQIKTISLNRLTLLPGATLDMSDIMFIDDVRVTDLTMSKNAALRVHGCHFRNFVYFSQLNMQGGSLCLIESKIDRSLRFTEPDLTKINEATMLVVDTTIQVLLEITPKVQHSNVVLWDMSAEEVQVRPGVQSHAVFGEGVRVKNVGVTGCQTSDSAEECSMVVSDSATLGDGGSVKATGVTKLTGDHNLQQFRPLLATKCQSLVLKAPSTSTTTISLSRPPTRTSTFIVHTNTTTTSPSASAEPTQSLSRSQAPPKTPSVSIHTDTPSQHTTPSRDPTLSISRSLDPTPPPSSPVPLPSPIPSTVLDQVDTPTQPPIAAPTTAPIPPSESPRTPQPATKRSLMVTISFGDNEKVGEAVAASGASSVAVTSVFSPTAASKLSRVVSAAKAVSCVMTEDDERPSFFELPIQYPIGDGSMRYYAGGALASAFLCVGLFLVVVLLRNVAQSSAKANSSSAEDKPISVQLLKAAGVFAAVALLFLAPSIVGAAVTVGVHGNSLERRMSLASLFIMFLVVGFVAFMLTRRFDVKTETKQKVRGGDKHHQNDTNDAASFTIEFKDAQQGSMYVAAYQALFDATDNPSSTVKRLYSVEELVVSSLVAGIAGIRPGGDHCSSVSIAILVAVVAHLVYVVYFHPLRTKIDHYFSVFFAVVQVIMGIACVVATKWIETDDEAAAETPLKVLSMTVFIMFVGFFVQTIVQGYWAFHTFKRREHAADPGEEDTQAGNQQESTSSSDNDDDSKNAATTRLQRGVRRTFSEVTTSSDDSTSDDDDSSTSSSDDDDFKRGPPPQHHLLSVPFLGASERRGSCDGGVAPTNPLCEPPPPPPPPPPE